MKSFVQFFYDRNKWHLVLVVRLSNYDHIDCLTARSSKSIVMISTGHGQDAYVTRALLRGVAFLECYFSVIFFQLSYMGSFPLCLSILIIAVAGADFMLPRVYTVLNQCAHPI